MQFPISRDQLLINGNIVHGSVQHIEGIINLCQKIISCLYLEMYKVNLNGLDI